MESASRLSLSLRRIRSVLILVLVASALTLSAHNWFVSDPEFDQFDPPYILAKPDDAGLSFDTAERQREIYATALSHTSLADLFHNSNGLVITDVSQDSIDEWRHENPLINQRSDVEVRAAIIHKRLGLYTDYAKSYGEPWGTVAGVSAILFVVPVAIGLSLIWLISVPIPKFVSWILARDVA